ncbi:MAG: hypothetical protein GQE15_13290 [Archangiaceae bacterium]|nr:hypothetical protein [Archangiaceae bacterium]
MSSTLVALLLLAQSVDPLAEAQRAFDELQFERALTLTPPPANWSGFSREEVVHALTLRALCLASVKRDDEARLAFRQLLALEPGWQLPDQFGPRVRTLVLEAKDAVSRGGRLSLAVESGAVVIGGDAFGLAQSVAMSWRMAGETKSVKAPVANRIEPPWSSSEPVDVWLTLLGPADSVLLEWGTAAAPKHLAPAVVASTPGPAQTPTRLSTFGIAGIIAAGVGVAALGSGVFALTQADQPRAALAAATRDAEGRITSLTQREAFLLDARANGAWQAAGVLLVAGGVALAAGVTLFLIGPVTVSASPSGASLMVPFDADFAVGALR